MTLHLSVHLLPELIEPEKLRGTTAVVIDVLRATTTICQALEAGARDVLPCLTIEDARREAAALPEAQRVLGGERGGLAIDGFDLGNSPAEYTVESVGGKTVVFTTTNGTKAIRQCRHAEQVWIGCAGNVRAVCDRLATRDEVHLVCAGTEGQITRDDALIAGAIVEGLMGPESACEPDDVARLVRAAWRNVRAASMARGMGLPHHLAVEFEDSRGGRNLLAIGHADDLAVAARMDCFDFVPVLDRETGRIVRG